MLHLHLLFYPFVSVVDIALDVDVVEGNFFVYLVAIPNSLEFGDW